MKARFTEKQNGKWIIAISFVLAITAVIMIMTNQVEEALTVSAVLVMVIMLLVAVLFAQLKTEVYEDKITLSFGAGIIRKNIPLKGIKEVSVVKNKWYYGWGIRFYGKGWMWNIWGLGAIEIEFNDKKSFFRIGSQNPEKLKTEIDNLLRS